MAENIKIALAGNPNCGKTTIFNNLTGARQHVGNYPGVTVERKVGHTRHKNYEIEVLDLPGIYSLTAYSQDEVVARNAIIQERPDVIVNILDAANLQRNLLLTAQLKELGLPIIIVLNMIDTAETQGMRIDDATLVQLTGAPIVRTVGVKNQGTTDILDVVIDMTTGKTKNADKPIRYGDELEEEITYLQKLLSAADIKQVVAAGSLLPEQENTLRRWVAVKLLEADRDILQRAKALPDTDKLLSQLQRSTQHLNSIIGDPETAIMDGRNAFARGVYHEAVTYVPGTDPVSATDKIDKFLLSRVLGLPIFLGIMWLVFQLTFTLGAPLADWLSIAFEQLGEIVSAHMADGLLKSLVVDGIISGVGGVLVFVPNILLLFLAIAFLEDSGYMARAAFVMDKIMHRVGLHGKSFIPMMIGFGCNIPAFMATRTLENERDRLVTMMVIPLMSCGARLPVYTLLIAAFFHQSVAGNILFAIYLIGIALAIVVAKVLRTWVFPGESEPFVMELPSYRMPTLKGVLIHMWDRGWLYVKKAGTIILAVSIIMWALLTYPLPSQDSGDIAAQLEYSYAGRVGHIIEPVMEPLGFDWRTGVALVAGFAAKEVVVSTLGTLYSIGDSDALEGEDPGIVGAFAEQAKKQSGFNPLKAFVLMLFTLIYVPCMAAIAVLHRETNGWKWPAVVIVYTTTLAWILSFVVYRVGLWLGIGVG